MTIFVSDKGRVYCSINFVERHRYGLKKLASLLNREGNIGADKNLDISQKQASITNSWRRIASAELSSILWLGRLSIHVYG